MALLFMDSFDHYVTADITEKWTSTATGSFGNALVINSTAGRRSSGGLRFTEWNNAGTNGISKSFTASGTTAIIGLSQQVAASGSLWGVMQVLSGSTPQVSLIVGTDLSLYVVRGGFGSSTVLGTSIPGVISSGVHRYIEMKVLLSTTVGTVEVRVDNNTVLNLTSLNTAATGTASWNGAAICHMDTGTSVSLGGVNHDFDDFYVCDGSGSAPWNTFLGDCRVDARFPTAAGATTGWTPLSGSNWDNVNDTAPDDDTTYNSAASTGLTDTFVTQDAPVVGATIYGIQHCISMKKSDAGLCTVAPVVRHSSTDNVGTSMSPGTGYSYGLAINQTNPGTSAAWVEADFNAAEFGYKRLT